MYDPQQQQPLFDLQETTGFGSDPKSWLSGDDFSRTLSSLSAAAANAAATGTFDRVLYNDLVEIVPLVQSLIDQKANTSYARRSSMIYTKAPSRESLYKKTAGRTSIQQGKKQKDKDQSKIGANNQDGSAEDISIFSSRSLLSEKDREELITLRNQVEDLKRQLSEKDELLKSVELSKDEMSSIQTKFDELKSEAAAKDSLIKTTQLQLSDLKIKLADKQAAVEKFQWEAMNSSKKVERLEEDLQSREEEISSFMLLIEGLSRKEFTLSDGDYDVFPYSVDQSHEQDYLNEIEMRKLEVAREAYTDAVAAAKINQDERSIAAAASARSHLQSLLKQCL